MSEKMDGKQAVACNQAWRVAQKLSGAVLDAHENRVWSPACVAYLLTVAVEGSAGQTRVELDELLGGGSILESGKSPLALLANRIATGSAGSRPDPFGLQVDADWCYENYEAHSSAALWLAKSASPKKTFLKACRHGGVKVAFCDFADPRTGQAVGEWICEQTRGLLSPEVQASPDALACLVGALYFKDAWAFPFDCCDTKNQIFHCLEGDIEVPFMHGVRSCQVAEADGSVAVSVLLSSGARLLFALPREGGTALHSMLTLLERLACDDACWESVDINLPRFECETTVDDLVEPLVDAGVTTAPTMNLTSMVGDKSAFAQIVHGARLAVDENGVEAGAYTMMLIAPGCAAHMEEPPTPRVLVLDRPFIVALVSRTGSPLFLGTVAHPLPAA